jgi:hypothetical protein
MVNEILIIPFPHISVFCRKCSKHSVSDILKIGRGFQEMEGFALEGLHVQTSWTRDGIQAFNVACCRSFIIRFDSGVIGKTDPVGVKVR